MLLNLAIDIPSGQNPQAAIQRIRKVLEAEFGIGASARVEIAPELSEMGQDERYERNRQAKKDREAVDDYDEKIQEVVRGIPDEALGVYKYADDGVKLMRKYEIAVEKLEKGVEKVHKILKEGSVFGRGKSY